MENSIKLNHYAQLNHLAETASQFPCDVSVYDAAGNMANAKSILGLMRLDLHQPIRLVSDNDAALRILVRRLS